MGETISTQVQAIIAEHLAEEHGEPVPVGPEAHLYNELGFDSLDIVEVVITLEETFKIEIDDEAAMDAQTVPALVEIVETRLQKA